LFDVGVAGQDEIENRAVALGRFHSWHLQD
jgi:hypothetical protein